MESSAYQYRYTLSMVVVGLTAGREGRGLKNRRVSDWTGELGKWRRGGASFALELERVKRIGMVLTTCFLTTPQHCSRRTIQDAEDTKSSSRIGSNLVCAACLARCSKNM